MKLHLGTLTRLHAAIDPDPEVVAGAVKAWRHGLNKRLPHALDWDESPTAPFEAVEVGEWDALCASAAEQLVQPDLWLPGDHDFLFNAQDLAGKEICVASSAELLRALQHVPDGPGRHALARLARRSMQFMLPLAKIGP